MNRREMPRRNSVHRRKNNEETIDLLKDAFVCVSIPVVAFSIAYITLDVFVGLFLG